MNQRDHIENGEQVQPVWSQLVSLSSCTDSERWVRSGLFPLDIEKVFPILGLLPVAEKQCWSATPRVFLFLDHRLEKPRARIKSK